MDNGSRLRSARATLEGFASVWWLWQHGQPDVVATMGADCGDEQATLIVALVCPGGHVSVLSDGDEAGDRGVIHVLVLVSRSRFVRWLRRDRGRQPTGLSSEAITGVIAEIHY